MTYRFRLRLLLPPALLAFAAWADRAPALIEEVLVTRAGTDDAVIQRLSGECWWQDFAAIPPADKDHSDPRSGTCGGAVPEGHSPG